MLSINWLPLSDRKNISTPKIHVEEFNNQNYGGYYWPGRATIVVVDWPNPCLEAVLAHEYRHHIQFELNQLTCAKGSTLDSSGDYRRDIRKYFRTQRHEYDALCYEFKHAKCEQNNWWLNHLVNPRKLPENY